MNFNPVLLLPAVVLAVLAGAVARQTLLVMRARSRARRRMVEAPNSHYDPRAVRNIEARQRWAEIRLDLVHEVNRGEVERLLARAEALGSDSLEPRERQFLDVILENTRAS